MLDLTADAAPYVGAPYRLLGREPTGWDCWGLVRFLRTALLGKPSPCWSEAYGLDDTLNGALPDRAEFLIRQNLAAWRPCDGAAAGRVALFRAFGRDAHVALCLNDHSFIHAWEGTDTVIASLHEDRWARRLVGFYDAD